MRTAARMLIGVACIALAVNSATAETMPDACKLLSRMEIQREIGGTATGFEHATPFRNSSTSMCQGSVGGATVTVRVSIESEEDRANEQTIAHMMSASGGEVETVTAGALTCSTMAPGPSMMEYGSDSICRISRSGLDVAVQANVHDRKAMVPVARLRPLVTLAAGRLKGRQL